MKNTTFIEILKNIKKNIEKGYANEEMVEYAITYPNGWERHLSMPKRQYNALFDRAMEELATWRDDSPSYVMGMKEVAEIEAIRLLHPDIFFEDIYIFKN